ncbi:type VII secretion system-associated protein [Streptomyces sp. NPDC060028]|uniref:type VII secretion system-associated protein n=1 Tax=Streptomyces sp. NPDC060028 TaxID=3347041 RepID=UPI0036BCEF9B
MSENSEPTPTLPPVPEDIREAARQAPEHWLAVIDPAWDGEEAPPAWAVRGQWRSDEAGEVVEWQENPDYRPSPESLGWPQPTDALDSAVQLSATGYGPAEAVSTALAQASLAVHTTADGLPVTAAAPDGTPVVAVYSCASYLQAAGRFAYQVLPLPELAALLPAGHELYVNPTAGVAMRIEDSVLSAALEILRQEPEQEPEELPEGAPVATLPEPLAPLPRVRVTSDGPARDVRP